MDGNEWMEVSSDGIPLCRIKYNGQFLSNADQNLSDEYRSKIADIQDEISTVREYVGLYEHAPHMCVAMLIGTTFAWFTDTASTAVNKIQAGTLDVKLLAEDGVTSLEGATLEWQKAAGAEDEDILWEPGCRYKLQPIIIKNAGTLALKYKIVISGIAGDATSCPVLYFDS